MIDISNLLLINKPFFFLFRTDRKMDRRTDISDSRVAIATVNIIIQAKPRDPKPSRSTITLDVDLTSSFTDWYLQAKSLSRKHFLFKQLKRFWFKQKAYFVQFYFISTKIFVTQQDIHEKVNGIFLKKKQYKNSLKSQRRWAKVKEMNDD